MSLESLSDEKIGLASNHSVSFRRTLSPSCRRGLSNVFRNKIIYNVITFHFILAAIDKFQLFRMSYCLLLCRISDWLIHSFFDLSIIHSFIYPIIHSSIHSFIHPFIRSFTHSSIHSFIHSFIHPIIHSSIHSFIHPFIHSFVHSPIHPFIYSFTHSFIHSFIRSFDRDSTLRRTAF